MLSKLLHDPPPSHAFELSEAGLSVATVGGAPQIKFEPFPEGLVSVSPFRDNIPNPELLVEKIRAAAPGNGRKRRAAVILPDYCARVAVLDFDSFPSSREEQEALIRFRVKKSVPFDIDSAILSYYAQPAVAGQPIEVVVAVIALEIIARYEAPFRQAAFHPGMITTSALAILNMLKPSGITVVGKLNGRTLTILVIDHNTLKLARCMEMEEASMDEIDSIMHPTFVYIEDELHAKPERLLTCGFGPDTNALAAQWQAEWNIVVEPVRSRFGMPKQTDAGLLGYLEGVAA